MGKIWISILVLIAIGIGLYYVIRPSSGVQDIQIDRMKAPLENETVVPDVQPGKSRGVVKSKCQTTMSSYGPFLMYTEQPNVIHVVQGDYSASFSLESMMLEGDILKPKMHGHKFAIQRPDGKEYYYALESPEKAHDAGVRPVGLFEDPRKVSGVYKLEGETLMNRQTGESSVVSFEDMDEEACVSGSHVFFRQGDALKAYSIKSTNTITLFDQVDEYHTDGHRLYARVDKDVYVYDKLGAEPVIRSFKPYFKKTELVECCLVRDLIYCRDTEGTIKWRSV